MGEQDANWNDNKYRSVGEEKERDTDDIWGEEESVPRDEQNYESEEEVQTVGDSDTTTSNSSMETKRPEQMSDDDELNLFDQE